MIREILGLFNTTTALRPYLTLKHVMWHPFYFQNPAKDLQAMTLYRLLSYF